jgi:hypothetical protein
MDSHIMISMQIAIVGIVVVVGLFILWRRIAKLEERVDALMQPMHAGCGWTGEGEGAAGEGATEDMGDGEAWAASAGQGEAQEHWAAAAQQAWASPEDIMSAVFDVQLDGPLAPALVPKAHVVEVEEKPVLPAKPSVPATTMAEPDLVTATEAAHAVEAVVDTDAEADTESMVAAGGMSKTRLRKMPVDVLKEMCLIRGLASEGTKNVLVDRIFDSA